MPRRKKQVLDQPQHKPTDIIHLEDVYAVINYVQVSRQGYSFIASPDDAMIMENIFTDCEMKFERFELEEVIKYSLMPPPIREIPEEIFILDEEYQDEILEDGQCF